MSGEMGMSGQVAGYRLDRLIGQSDMAAVYLGRDKERDRPVAVKVLAPELTGQTAFRTRWLSESRAAAALGHPHILPVYAAGDAAGVLYVAMRYVPGGDIRSLLTRIGPLPPAMAWTILTQAASALDAAHARGLIHRDVKPANMLLEASHTYLADFGTGADTSRSFDYVAPEQIDGRPLDGRTDLYSLACVGFELLCGTPLFEQDQPLTVMYAQLYAPPPSVGTRRDGLPAAVDVVLATALAKDPADRYASCGQFAEELSEALGLAGQPATLAPPRPPDRGGPAPEARPGMPPSPPGPWPSEDSLLIPGMASRAGPDPGRPPRRPVVITVILAAAVLAVVAVTAAVVMGGGAPKAPALSSPTVSRPAATSAAPRSSSPTPSPSALAPSAVASGQAATVNHLLESSAATRQALGGAINEILNCTNLSGAASQIQDAVSQRGAEYRQASALSASALPQGAAVKSGLIAALRTSLDADQDYLTWAQQELDLGCTQPEQSTAYGAANRADQAADAAKQAFVQVWNSVAARYGVPPKSAGSI